MQNEVDEADKRDFSAYALELGDHPYHKGVLSPDEYSVMEKWRGPCGDSIAWFLKIENEQIKKVFFTTSGCITSDMAGSQTVKMIENKAISEVRKLTDKDVLKALGKFPKSSWHCTTLAVTGLNLTLDKYQKMQNDIEIK
ncbi:MAG: iron-sulfur cluster assembly scaffold protein [Promethearchaeota archaeon]